ncbi:hypothetical protein ALC57_18059 [Trachymyrmex cornetzi]|uniref:Uncharacterized protein n=1 Tax=Trachymyrmex cornetzi TaxID=471704 RepID=A0A151ISG5_9HYME|nr:hypothetical protein ALC57_18059 [Trachymyrmex cornetzi]
MITVLVYPLKGIFCERICVSKGNIILMSSPCLFVHRSIGDPPPISEYFFCTSGIKTFELEVESYHDQSLFLINIHGLDRNRSVAPYYSRRFRALSSYTKLYYNYILIFL